MFCILDILFGNLTLLTFQIIRPTIFVGQMLFLIIFPGIFQYLKKKLPKLFVGKPIFYLGKKIPKRLFFKKIVSKKKKLPTKTEMANIGASLGPIGRVLSFPCVMRVPKNLSEGSTCLGTLFLVL